jgi:PIN domain nuclease of toxin-antitoxin system
MIILDTHVLIWFAEDDRRLGKQTTAAVDAALQADELGVAAISFWEIAMLARKGRLELAEPPAAVRRKVLDQGILEIVMDGVIGIHAAELSDFHGDPADRIIVATSMMNEATLVTADREILHWHGQLRARNARR